MNDYTGLLYARPSFIEGIARIVDLRGTLNEYNKSATGDLADREALEADWRALGQDFAQAVKSYRASRPELIDGTK